MEVIPEEDRVKFVLENEEEAYTVLKKIESQIDEYDSGSFGWRVFRRLKLRAKNAVNESKYPTQFVASLDDASMLEQCLDSVYPEEPDSSYDSRTKPKSEISNT